MARATERNALFKGRKGRLEVVSVIDGTEDQAYDEPTTAAAATSPAAATGVVEVHQQPDAASVGVKQDASPHPSTEALEPPTPAADPPGPAVVEPDTALAPSKLRTRRG